MMWLFHLELLALLLLGEPCRLRLLARKPHLRSQSFELRLVVRLQRAAQLEHGALPKLINARVSQLAR